MKKKFYLLPLFSLIFILSCSKNIDAQIAGIELNTEEALDGYTLFIMGGEGTFLIDNCGDVVNEWSNVIWADFHPKLLPNGNLLYQANSTIYEINWNGSVAHSVSIVPGSYQLVYEVLKLPNGNYLSVGRRNYSSSDFIELGFDFGTFQVPSEMDVVFEIDYNTGAIAWEWNLADHVIQERDPSVNNYGVVADHPELFDMDALSTYDWTFQESFMINGLDYHPQFDQIALSVRKMNEIVIIDHSTTTAEAAGHTGGNSGKGGDILYRWGNPQNYGQGNPSDRFLFFQHNPKWITSGPQVGKMTCFDNGLDRPTGFYSQVPIISLPVDGDGNYALTPGTAFEPVAPDFIYGATTSETEFYSDYTSGAELLPNGNMFITEGVWGRLLEVNPSGDIVWQYTVPNASYIFRTEKYAANYPAFDGKNLVPTSPAPGSNSTYNCELFTTQVNELDYLKNHFSLRYLSQREIEIVNTYTNGFSYSLFDVQGRSLLSGISTTDRMTLSLEHLPSGFYVLSTMDDKEGVRYSNKIMIP